MSVSAPPNADTCLVCIHYQGDKLVNDPTDPNLEPDHILYCKAFPDGIPADITDGIVEHKRKFAGDHGIQFEKEPTP